MACEYCMSEKPLLESPSFHESSGVQSLINDGVLSVTADFESGYVGDFESIAINYCPMCGEKLGDAS